MGTVSTEPAASVDSLPSSRTLGLSEIGRSRRAPGNADSDRREFVAPFQLAGKPGGRIGGRAGKLQPVNSNVSVRLYIHRACLPHHKHRSSPRRCSLVASTLCLICSSRLSLTSQTPPFREWIQRTELKLAALVEIVRKLSRKYPTTLRFRKIPLI